METLHFELENIKCGGCAKSIKNKLSELDGVQDVVVNFEQGSVEVCLGGTETTRDTILDKLASMGYPEKGKGNLAHKAVSFVSCAVGKIS
jgi:copper chaperone